MDTSAVTSSTAAAARAAATTATPTNVLGKDDFLKLLTAQLTNQDPLQPVDNQAFVAQLAQFSSLEQLQNVTSKLDSLIAATTSATGLQAASLVGKTVSFDADGVDVASGQAPRLQVQLDAPATVTAIVQDASGKTVRTLALGARSAGRFDLGWDGLDASGAAVPPGHYTVSLGARDASGNAVGVQGLASGTVQGVQVGASGTSLVVGGSDVNLSNVIEITQS